MLYFLWDLLTCPYKLNLCFLSERSAAPTKPWCRGCLHRKGNTTTCVVLWKPSDRLLHRYTLNSCFYLSIKGRWLCNSYKKKKNRMGKKAKHKIKSN